MSLLRIGFSLDDVRRTTMADFIAYTDIAFSTTGDGDDAPRDATQADIDAFLG